MHSSKMSLPAGHSKHNYVNLVLLGKTGNGKSSTGNSLLMEQEFKTTDDDPHGVVWESVTKVMGWKNSNASIQLREETKDDGVQLRIFDTPGFFDAEMTDEDRKISNSINDEITEINAKRASPEEREKVYQKLQKHREAAKLRRRECIREEMMKCIVKSCSEGGVHAFLYVIRYDERIDQSELDTLYLVQESFGVGKANFFDYLFLTVTAKDRMVKKGVKEADLLERLKNSDIGILKTVAENNRCFFINNKLLRTAQDTSKSSYERKDAKLELQAQRDSFIQMIMTNLKQKKSVFTSEDFQEAQQHVRRMVEAELREKAPELLEAYLTTQKQLNECTSFIDECELADEKQSEESHQIRKRVQEKYRRLFRKYRLVFGKHLKNEPIPIEPGSVRRISAHLDQIFQEKEPTRRQAAKKLVSTQSSELSFDLSPLSPSEPIAAEPVQEDNHENVVKELKQLAKKIEYLKVMQDEMEEKTRLLRLRRQKLRKNLQSAEDKFYELEDFHKERIAGGMKRFLHKVWAGTKGVFKLQPIQNARKGAEKFDEKVDFQAKMLAITQLQQEYPHLKTLLADGHQVLIELQNEIEEQKKIMADTRREEAELIQKMTQIEADLEERHQIDDQIYEQIYENLPGSHQADEDEDVFADFE